MAKDLRSFLRRIEVNAPSELVRVSRPVSPVYELPGVLRKLQSEGRCPVVLFEAVEGSDLRTISNVLGSATLLAEALETTPTEMTRAYIDREDAGIPYEVVDTGPAQDVVIGADDVNLHEIPIVTNCGKDFRALHQRGNHNCPPSGNGQLQLRDLPDDGSLA